MGHHRNIIRPDTCGCELEFEFDDELPNDQAEASFKLWRVHKCCPRHAALLPPDWDTPASQQAIKDAEKAENVAWLAQGSDHRVAATPSGPRYPLVHPLFDKVYHDELKRKNRALGHLQENFPTLRRAVPRADGSGVDEVLDETKVTWSYDAAGVLHLKLIGLSAGQRSQALAALLAEHGAGSVALD